MHICYKTNSQNPIKIYSSKKSLTVDPNTELDCSDFDINETIFVRSVFLKKEKRNIFGWFALFFGKLFVNIFNLIILNYPEHCFQYDDFTGFSFAFKCAISDVCIDYEQKQLKNRPEKYILVNGERKECIEIFDYDCFNNSVTKILDRCSDLLVVCNFNYYNLFLAYMVFPILYVNCFLRYSSFFN